MSNNAYIADGYSGLRIVDISNRNNPQEIGYLNTSGYAQDVAVAGNYAYLITEYDNGLHIINVANPSNPIETSFLSLSGSVRSISIENNYAYIATSENLEIIDITSPSNPIRRGFLSGGIMGAFVSGNYAYVSKWYDGLRIIDISNPSNPYEVGSYDIWGPTMDAVINNNKAYVSVGERGLFVLDVTTPATPQLIGEYNTAGSTFRTAIIGEDIFATDQWGGFYTLQNIPDGRPIATLHTITPSDATQGQDVIFRGSGFDLSVDNESIEAYQWRSSLDGVLGSQAEFTLSAANLSVGTHTIYFKVQDNEGEWSEEVSRSLIVSAGAGTPVGSINYIWYGSLSNAAVQGVDTLYFNGDGYDTDEGGAYITGYEWSSNLDGVLSSQEDFTIQASTISAGTHTISFRVKDNENEWSLPVTRQLTVESSQADVQTLILVNRQKLEALYGTTAVSPLMTRLNSFAAHSDVDGLVVQVENDGQVAAAYAARGSNYSNKNKANAVVEAIRTLTLEYWTNYPDLEYLVIIGDDRAMPFYRTADGTYYPDDWTMTDDYYADKEPTACTGCANPYVYIPDLGNGRLIESPSQIIGQLDTFLAGSAVSLNSAAVAGYDFIQDGAEAHCTTIRNDGISTNCQLMGNNWSSTDFISQILNVRHDLISINAHANAFGFGTPNGFVADTDFRDASADFSRSIFFTVGCHSGQNVYGDIDLPESMAIIKANYVANTGYGWGGGGIVLSEELMWNFSKKLTYGAQSTPGQALMEAKQQYFAEHPQPGPYIEKISTEAVLYGLPMYQVASASSLVAKRTAVESENSSVSVQNETVLLSNGLSKESSTYSWPMPTAVINPDGSSYYPLFGKVSSTDGVPVLPLFTMDVSKPQQSLIDIVFTGGNYSSNNLTPMIQSFYTNSLQTAPPQRIFTAQDWSPTLLVETSIVELENGRRETLVASAGQYNPNLTTGQQRIFTDMNFDKYYHADSTDWDKPTISHISSQLTGNQINVLVKGGDESGITAVVVAYTNNDGTWHSITLAEQGNDWSSSFTGDQNSIFFVQMVDNTGNVAAQDFNGSYFRAGDSFTANTYIYLPVIVK